MIVTTTPRLVLQQFSSGDADGFYRLNLDPEVIRYTGDSSFETVEQARQFIQNYDHYENHGFGRWSVYLKTGEYLGFCGLRRCSETQEVDIGFRFLRQYWRQGYALEASLAVLKLAFERYRLPKVVARAMEDNLASHGVIRRLGFSPMERVVSSGAYWRQYQLTASDWRAMDYPLMQKGIDIAKPDLSRS